MKRLILAAAVAAAALNTAACASLPGAGSSDNLALLKEVNAHIEKCDVQGQATSGPIPTASFSFNCKAQQPAVPAAP